MWYPDAHVYGIAVVSNEKALAKIKKDAQILQVRLAPNKYAGQLIKHAAGHPGRPPLHRTPLAGQERTHRNLAGERRPGPAPRLGRQGVRVGPNTRSDPGLTRP
ncbi:hypothetical protein GCM10022236_14510 [Microlunatus ginsengisoli]|uniref:Uncharacterized protein n=1 Tax=Microlunatus ginsengisoli TaxID=363863 RepID=A0ABP6ZM45_9ACTN